MKIERTQFLQMENDFLRELLASTPSDDVITQGSLNASIELNDEELRSTSAPARRPLTVLVTFRGRPVVGQHGIFAGFGARAADLFAASVVKIAASLAGPVADKGPVPYQEDCKLLITGTATGSFGFEFGEYRPGQLSFNEETRAEEAVRITQSILASTQGTDDELAESLSATNLRAVNALTEFLQHLESNDATCSVTKDAETVSFNDVRDVRQAIARLGQDNYHEETEEFVGHFQGILPDARTFEFVIGDSLMRGKVVRDIDTGEIKKHMDQPARIRALVVILGRGRPRYTLIEMPTWNPE